VSPFIEMSAHAYCLCPRGSNSVRGIARGAKADEVLVTIQNDGVVCYSSARQVSCTRTPSARKRPATCMHCNLLLHLFDSVLASLAFVNRTTKTSSIQHLLCCGLACLSYQSMSCRNKLLVGPLALSTSNLLPQPSLHQAAAVTMLWSSKPLSAAAAHKLCYHGLQVRPVAAWSSLQSGLSCLAVCTRCTPLQPSLPSILKHKREAAAAQLQLSTQMVVWPVVLRTAKGCLLDQ